MDPVLVAGEQALVAGEQALVAGERAPVAGEQALVVVVGERGSAVAAAAERVVMEVHLRYLKHPRLPADTSNHRPERIVHSPAPVYLYRTDNRVHNASLEYNIRWVCSDAMICTVLGSPMYTSRFYHVHNSCHVDKLSKF